uniref:WAP domain-containing protein n=1 Tax=Laticauda laticaudata TaxID=8630 RepID=A0A8C5RZ63_LATLA
MKSPSFWLLLGMGATPGPFWSQESIPGKAGRCPVGSAQQPLPSKLYCLSDASCPGHEKCCSLGRMRICVQPALGRRAAREGGAAL